MATESWRNRKTLILSRTDMTELVTPAEYVACVEQADRMHGEGCYYMDPKGHIVLESLPLARVPRYVEGTTHVSFAAAQLKIRCPGVRSAA